MSITIDDDFKEKAKIKVIGVGGAGCNALNWMIEEQNEVHGVEFIAVNTDSQSLNKSDAHLKIQIGQKTTSGLGAGAKPEVGQAAAEEDIEEIKENIEGADMVIITAGMGGGTGTGAAPVIARAAKELGILTVSVATTPFFWEGPKRTSHAKIGMTNLTNNSDSIIVISNNKIQQSLKDRKNVNIMEGFKEADRVLKDAVSGISSLIQEHGIINLDFSDVRTIMSDGGRAYIGIGYGTGDDKVEEAVNSAIKDVLLDDVNIKGAGRALIQVVLGNNIGFDEMEQIQTKIYDALQHDEIETNMVNGVMQDPNLEDGIRVLVIATSLMDGDDAVIEAPKKTAPTVATLLSDLAPKAEPKVAEPVIEEPVVAAPKVEEVQETVAPVAPVKEPSILDAVSTDPTTDDIIDSILAEEDEIVAEAEEEEFSIPDEPVVEEEEEESLFSLDNIDMDSKGTDSTEFPAFLKNGGEGISSGKKVDRKVIADMYDERKSIPAFLRKMMD